MIVFLTGYTIAVNSVCLINSTDESITYNYAITSASAWGVLTGSPISYTEETLTLEPNEEAILEEVDAFLVFINKLWQQIICEKSSTIRFSKTTAWSRYLLETEKNYVEIENNTDQNINISTPQQINNINLSANQQEYKKMTLSPKAKLFLSNMKHFKACIDTKWVEIECVRSTLIRFDKRIIVTPEKKQH